ncbi:MAG: HAD family hydrolase [Salinirussus sp.]
MSVTAVGFDLDGTLVVTERDRQTLLDEATATAGVRDIDRAEYLAAHSADVATETRTPIFARILEEGDPEAVARAYREAVEGALVPVPGAPGLVRELREEHGYSVGLLTDGPRRAQLGKLDALGWRDLFDAVAVTGTLPAGKPDRRAFEALTDRLGVTAAGTVYVGDNPVADVQGAARAGLTAVQVRADDGDSDPAADATVPLDGFADGIRDVLTRTA